ncbi:MAG TPA: hypothetical protein PKB02_11240 [Anaerohalosphaeraceae bacterium]|nr:hypothetical protein [Anaerohalosphaeraceae bacterium]
MKNSKIILLSITMFFCGCCSNTNGKLKQFPLSFEQASKIAIEHLNQSSYYINENHVLINEPDNAFWNAWVSRYPEMLKDYGLMDKDYFAVIFYERGVRDGGAIVFVDKDEKRVIGVLYGKRFVKNLL